MTTRHEILTRLEPIVSKETFEVLSDDSSDEQTLQMYYQSRKDYEDIEKLEETQALNKLEENCSVSPKKLSGYTYQFSLPDIQRINSWISNRERLIESLLKEKRDRMIGTHNLKIESTKNQT